LQPAIEPEGGQSAWRIGAQKGTAKRHAAQPEDGWQQSRCGGAGGEGAAQMEACAAVKARQIEARVKRKMGHDQPARKRVQHGPALRIMQGGEAMAKATLQRVKPWLIRAATEE